MDNNEATGGNIIHIHFSKKEKEMIKKRIKEDRIMFYDEGIGLTRLRCDIGIAYYTKNKKERKIK